MPGCTEWSVWEKEGGLDADKFTERMFWEFLRFLLLQATIAGGGVVPHIHKSLISKQNKKEGI